MEIEVRSCRGLLRPFVIIAAIIITVRRTAITSAKISSSGGRKMSLQVIERCINLQYCAAGDALS